MVFWDAVLAERRRLEERVIVRLRWRSFLVKVLTVSKNGFLF